MKKVFLLIALIFLTTGCSLTKDNLENANIYTTVYPIEYLVKTLYGDYSTINSIYPTGVDTDEYKLTKKQIKEYSDSDIFVYNGLSDEKKITKDFINKNKNLLIIDVSYGLSYKDRVEELWLSPNNYLMLAKNLKDDLNEYVNNPKIIDDVNSKYYDFSESLSLMDADLRSIGKEAQKKGTNTIVVSDDAFNYLNNYNFNVISLDEKSATETTLTNVKSALEKGDYKAIITSENVSDDVKKMIDDKNISTIKISTMKNADINDYDYIEVMQRFIGDIRNLVLAD